MNKLVLGLSISLGLALGLAACNKPSTDDCRKAILNMQSLLGTEHVSPNQDIEGDVRQCKGASSKEAVQCAINAKTLAELNACDFMKVPEKKK